MRAKLSLKRMGPPPAPRSERVSTVTVLDLFQRRDNAVHDQQLLEAETSNQPCVSWKTPSSGHVVQVRAPELSSKTFDLLHSFDASTRASGCRHAASGRTPAGSSPRRGLGPNSPFTEIAESVRAVGAARSLVICRPPAPQVQF
jgi:hypothetical protein